MIYVSKEKAEFYSGDGYSGMDYPMTDADINVAVIKINEIELNTKTYTVTVNGNNINLSKTEFEILKLLMQNSNKVVTKSIIFDTVWDNFYSADDNTGVSIEI